MLPLLNEVQVWRIGDLGLRRNVVIIGGGAGSVSPIFFLTCTYLASGENRYTAPRWGVGLLCSARMRQTATEHHRWLGLLGPVPTRAYPIGKSVRTDQ